MPTRGQNTRKDWSLLRPVEIQQTDDRILEALAEAVTHAQLGAGDRLPPERVIGEMIGVSRNTVREALKRWEAMGIVEMRRGSGTYLKTAIGPRSLHIGLTVSAPETAKSMLDVLEVRRGLESEAAALCARRASDADIEELGKLVDALVAIHKRYGAAPREDLAFHRALIACSHSPLLSQMIDAMNETYTRLWANPLKIHNYADRSLPFHVTVFEAIRSRDPDAARAEMIKLIDSVEQEIRELTDTRAAALPTSNA